MFLRNSLGKISGFLLDIHICRHPKQEIRRISDEIVCRRKREAADGVSIEFPETIW